MNLQAFLDCLPVAAGAVDPTGVVLALNPIAAGGRTLGFGEAVGRSLVELLTLAGCSADVQNRVAAAIASASQGRRVTDELPVAMGDQATVWIRMSFAPLVDDAATAQNVVWTGTDITSHVELQLQLQKRSRQLEEAIRSAAIGTFEWNLQTSEFQLSDLARRIYGFAPDTIPGIEALRAIIPTHDWPRLTALLARLQYTGARLDVEHEVLTPDGPVRWVRVTADIVEGDTPAHRLLLGTVCDVSAMKAAHERVRHTVAALEEAQALAHIGSWEVDESTRLFLCSDEVFRILEMRNPNGPIPRDVLFQRVHPEDRTRVHQDFLASAAARSDYSIEHRLQMPDGRVKHIRHAGRHTFDRSGGLIRSSGTIQDITEQVRLSQELRETATLLKAVMDASPDWIFVKDAQYRYVYANRAFIADLGLTGPFAGLVDTAAVASPMPEEVYRGADNRALAGETVRLPNLPVPLPNGTVRINDTLKVPVQLDSSGSPAILTIARDVSDRRRAEEALETLNRDLEATVTARTAHLEAANAKLEAFAYTVSHDLKAPIRAVDGYSRLLLDTPGLATDEEARGFVRAIRRAVDRIDTLTDDILEYSRVNRHGTRHRRFRPVDLVTSALAGIEHGLGSGCQARVSLPFEEAEGDVDGLTLVLRNLARNAVKAADPQRPLEIHVGGAADDTTWTIWMQDNGVGFDMRFHDRIFEWFEALDTSPQQPGTGLGLAIARSVMSRSGGRIWAESAPGKGATFYFSWPRAAPAH